MAQERLNGSRPVVNTPRVRQDDFVAEWLVGARQGLDFIAVQEEVQHRSER